MKIHEISINRPVAVLMCVLIVLVLGGVSYSRLPLDLFPDISFPVAIVSTTYSGAGPEEIENLVTKNIENAVATVNNVKTIQSQSSESSSIVIVEFNTGTDMDFATLQMREKIDMIKKLLPDDVDTPTVMKLDPNMMPVAFMGASGKSTQTELKKFIEDKVQPRLESLTGVAAVSVSGGQTREIKVEVDPQKMAGYGISFSNVVSALKSENLNLPGGTVEYGDKNLVVRSMGEFKSLDHIRNIPILLSSGNTIYIRDVAAVSDGFQKDTQNARMNGKDSIGLSVQKQSGSNTVKVVNLVKKEIEKIQKENPDIKIELIFDQAKYIEKAISNVASSLMLGAGLAVIILFVFLKNIRTTFIIGTAIPISVITTFVIMYFSGLTLNIISLGGLSIGVGMMVDNAIVVLENIYRHRNEGYSRIEAAKLGTQEVGGAVVASTLTTVVVFLPIVFVEGMAAQIFKELALTVAFSLFASLTVALTLVPMLSSKYLKMVKPHEASTNKVMNRILDKWEDLLTGLDSLYQNVLKWVLRHRKTTALTAAAIFLGSLFLLPAVGMELIPRADQGQFTVEIEMPHGTPLKQTDQMAEKVEQILMGLPELDKMFVNIGSSGKGISLEADSADQASFNIALKPLEERKRTTSQIVDEVRKKLEKISGAEFKVTESSSMGGGMSSGTPVSVEVRGPELDKLEEISDQVVKIVESIQGTRQVESSISEGRPEARIYVDRDKASNYKLSMAQVASVVKTAVDGEVATRYKVGADEFDVRVQFPEDDTQNFEQLKNIKILSSIGTEVLLSDIAQIRLEQGPVSISRKAQQRYVTVTADIFGRDLGSVNRDISNKLSEIRLPSEYEIKLGGDQESMTESFSSLAMALVLAVLLVYMVMAAQFESLLHPFTIMFSIPFAYTGSVLAMLITRRSLSIPSFIGIIMLAGIVVNNAIVLVDYVNTLRQKGMDRNEAIIKAGPTRLRPILMTTLTTILALVPMALGIGEGGETQAPMATVVIGGLTTSTMITLLIVPVFYTLFDDIVTRISYRKRRKLSKTIAG